MPRKVKAAPVIFEQANSNSAVMTPASPIVLEDKNMTQINEMNIAKLNLNSAVWDDRRQWVAPVQRPALNLSKDQVLAATPVPFLEELFNTGRIRLTQTANQSRENGIPVLFDNVIQIKQIFKAMAAVQYGVRNVWVAKRDNESREIYMYDVVGDHSRWLTETSNGTKVKYEVNYASVKFNNLGNETIVRGAVNPMQESLRVQVEGYNAWAMGRNAAVLNSVKGVELSADEIEFLKGTTANTDPNKFVQYNSVHLLNLDDMVNKYAIEAWLNLAETQPAFEIWTNAGSWEKAIARLERKLEVGIRAYRNELASLSGISIWDKQEVE